MNRRRGVSRSLDRDEDEQAFRRAGALAERKAIDLGGERRGEVADHRARRRAAQACDPLGVIEFDARHADREEVHPGHFGHTETSRRFYPPRKA